jgi:Protein of unknown function (DUF3617)
MIRRLILLGAIGTALMALVAAAPPSGLANVQPGLWEIQGVPGVAGAARQCVADVSLLARFEHRAKNCTEKLLKAAGSETDFDYTCGAAGFGHSEVTVITPRSLKISTQGISDGLPFNYVLQARRVADCPSAPRH